MQRTTTLELCKENQKFSAAHFTIFSPTERERLHGHNFQVGVIISAPVTNNGMAIDYRRIKDLVKSICHSLDEYVLLPLNSPFLKIEDRGDQWAAIFNGETMLFLKSDTRCLEIENITVEDLSYYILQRFRGTADEFPEITVRVSSGAGQWGSSTWRRDD